MEYFSVKQSTTKPSSNLTGNRFKLRRFSVMAMITVFAFSIMAVHANGQADSDQDSAEAVSLDSQATEARKLNDHKYACETWEKLLKQHPGYSKINNVRYNCGTSYYSLNQFEKAAEKFSAAIEGAADQKDFSLAEACHLYLGFSQFSIARKAKGDEAKEKYQAAIDTASQMVKKFPAGKYNDQALMFQGDAYFALAKLAKAAESYQQIIDNYTKSPYFVEAHNALGATLADLKQYEEAEKQLGKYVELAKAQNEKAKDDSSVKPIDVASIRLAEMGVADSVLNRANALKQKNQDQEANKLYAQAQADYDKLASIESFSERDRCLFQKGYCQIQQGGFVDAAETFESLAALYPDSKLREQAIMESGRAYYNGKKLDAAIEAFSKLQKSSETYALEAAHFHAQILLARNENAKAAKMAQAALTLGEKSHPYYVRLSMDYADALYQDPESKEKSIDVYLQIVEDFPKNEMAAQALYYAAFASYEVAKPRQAIDLADTFIEDFPKNGFTPDVLQVKADSLIQSENYADAEKIFSQVISDYGKHKNVGNWIVRRAVSQYFQKKQTEAIAGLTKDMEKIVSRRDQALANYWLAACQFDQSKWESVKTSAGKCIEIEPSNPRAPEATLLLARAQFQLKETSDAVDTAKKGLESYGDTAFAERLHFRLGEFYDELKQYDLAADAYLAVIKSGKNKSILPNSYYSLAWSQLKAKQLDSAIDSFTQVIDRFPKHSLRNDALLGRGMAHRQKNSHTKAIRDLESFIAADVPAEQKTNARFELGLAQVASKELDDAIGTFKDLLRADAKSKLADRVIYELAWALRDTSKPDEAIDQFEKLTTDHPDSPFAAEAFFHLAQADYDDKDYETAIVNYRKCIDKTKNTAHAEKATYKLAWSLFQQKKYVEAEKSFREQTEKYSKGPLNADGLFMVSECLFRQNKYSDAVTAYKIAAPEVARSSVDKNVKMRTLLHGAQSANKAKLYDEALKFAQPIVDRDTTDVFTAEAWLEIGLAQKAKKEFDKAIEAFRQSSKPINETGAHSYCMLGEVYFEQKEFDKAITEFKKVIYGFGGTRSEKPIQIWQAFAAFEAARCNHVQVEGEVDDSKRNSRIAEAIKLFQHVVENYPNDRLAPEAKKQLQRLKRL